MIVVPAWVVALTMLLFVWFLGLLVYAGIIYRRSLRGLRALSDRLDEITGEGGE